MTMTYRLPATVCFTFSALTEPVGVLPRARTPFQWSSQPSNAKSTSNSIISDRAIWTTKGTHNIPPSIPHTCQRTSASSLSSCLCCSARTGCFARNASIVFAKMSDSRFDRSQDSELVRSRKGPHGTNMHIAPVLDLM